MANSSKSNIKVSVSDKQTPKNVLADRYATPEMAAIFSDEGRIQLERQYWVIVMQAQKELGLDISTSVIADYRKVINKVDLDSIRQREKQTRHDVKAKIEEFNHLAGHERVHMGMTSRDLTENVEQLQIKLGLEATKLRYLATLHRVTVLAKKYAEVPMAGRSHNVAAQVTTLGKRFTNFGEEMLAAYSQLDGLISNLSLRGIKGPVGTQQDMLDLFEGGETKVKQLDKLVAHELGFEQLHNSVGQIYPRSADFQTVSVLNQLAKGPSSLATTIRLMAGNELVTEGFKEGQVGSSAMPHKMNARSSERINGLHRVLKGYVTILNDNSGEQWNEGDVSDSVPRRVAIPDAFYALDGLLQTTMTVLDEFGAYPAVIEKELNRYLPFLATTTVLMQTLKQGSDREVAHAAIKKHAVEVARAMREDGLEKNDLLDRLAADPAIQLSKSELDQLVAEPLKMTGLAAKQVASFVKKVDDLLKQNPDAATYQPGAIL